MQQAAGHLVTLHSGLQLWKRFGFHLLPLMEFIRSSVFRAVCDSLSVTIIRIFAHQATVGIKQEVNLLQTNPDQRQINHKTALDLFNNEYISGKQIYLEQSSLNLTRLSFRYKVLVWKRST